MRRDYLWILLALLLVLFVSPQRIAEFPKIANRQLPMASGEMASATRMDGGSELVPGGAPGLDGLHENFGPNWRALAVAQVVHAEERGAEQLPSVAVAPTEGGSVATGSSARWEVQQAWGSGDVPVGGWRFSGGINYYEASRSTGGPFLLFEVGGTRQTAAPQLAALPPGPSGAPRWELDSLGREGLGGSSRAGGIPGGAAGNNRGSLSAATAPGIGTFSGAEGESSSTPPVPEPSVIAALASLGVVGLYLAWRRWHRTNQRSC